MLEGERGKFKGEATRLKNWPTVVWLNRACMRRDFASCLQLFKLSFYYYIDLKSLELLNTKRFRIYQKDFEN